MIKYLYFLYLLVIPISNVLGQSAVLSGYVNDARTGEALQSGYNSQIYTGIREYSFKSDWEYYLSPKLTIHWGAR